MKNTGKRTHSIGAGEVHDSQNENGEAEMAPPQKKRRDAGSATQEEEDDATAFNLSQRPDFQYNVTMGSEAESGIIERVYVKNFMCHTRLEFSFLPQVNFIVGRNGSGKSAVLTAIVIGLGGKATVTNRANSAKKFIKNGRNSAEISVKLRNRGDDAYKPNLYGPSITIKRRLTVESSSNYRIENSEGKLISTKREELAHILEQFNIQVDNPVAILNQDTSRNFLHSKNSNDKYKFFLKATQLEQMKHDYVVANESKEIAQGILQRKEKTLPELEREVLECEQRFKALSSLDELRNKVNKLKDEMAWAFVFQKEKEVESSLKEVRQEEARTPKFVQKVEEFNAKVDACIQQQKLIQEQVKAFTEEARELDPKYQELKKVRETQKKSIRQTQLDLRKVTNEFNSCKKDRDQILERIDEIRNSAQQDYESERHAREERIAQLQVEVATLEATQKTTEQQMDQFSSAVSLGKENQYKIRSEEQDLKYKMEQASRNLTTMKSARNDRLKRYGQWMPAIQKKIQEAYQCGQFHQKPRGPIGASISLREGKWALAIEKCFAGLGHAFCVHDHHDGKVLEQIFNESCPEERKPSTIVSQFHNTLYDVSQNRPHTNRFPTVLDMLEIQDPVVGNCLIDQRGIESVLLFEDVTEARTVMGRNPPQNCREAFALNGDQLLSNPSFRYYSCPRDFKARHLTASLEDDIRAVEQEVVGMQQEQQTLIQNMNHLKRDIQANQREEQTCQTRLNKLRNQLAKLNFEIRELKNREDPAPVDVTTLEEEVEKYNEMLARLEEKKAAADQTTENAKQELEKVEKDFRNIDSRMRAITENAEPLKETLAEEYHKIEMNRKGRQHYEAKMKELQNKIAEAKEVYEKKKKELEEDTQKAEQMCERIRTRRTPQNLESEIQQINKRIKTEEKSRGNHEEVTRKYFETMNAFKKIKSEVKQLRNFLKKLQESLLIREMRYVEFRSSCSMRLKTLFIVWLSKIGSYSRMKVNHITQTLDIITLDQVMAQRQTQYFDFRRLIAMRAKCFFIVMLSNRQYTGKMNFNHQRETLDLSVQPTRTNGEGTKDMRALSGGERSFATVCFILALWDAMESPFRCLDEFDVFMDMVNRRISMDMMMDVAQQQKGRQFIFLTPLDMSIIRMNKNVRVYRMPDPDRGQGVLPFGEEEPPEED